MHLNGQADAAAVTILKRVGYNTYGLIEMLQEMEKRLKPGGLDFAKTHPSPKSRIEEITELIGDYNSAPATPARQARFRMALRNI